LCGGRFSVAWKLSVILKGRNPPERHIIRHFHKPPTHKSEKMREQNALEVHAIEAAT
jgi:hypothetical protein